MEKRTVSDLSANLRRLRDAKHMSQADIASAAGLSRVGYRNIETGAVDPRVNSLRRIAAALGVRLDDLLSPAHDLRMVRFRAHKRMTSRETLLATVARRLVQYRELERLLDDHMPWQLESLATALTGKRDKNRPIRAATKARSAMNIGERDVIRNICGLLEERGTKVLTPEVASLGFFGLSVADEELGPAVVVNAWDRISVERWIFTAAHELGHLLLHRSAYDVLKSDENEVEEREADLFASHFLMPVELFDREYAKMRGLGFIEQVLSLKRMFHVSYKTVLYRISEAQPAKKRGAVWERFREKYEKAYGTSLGRTDEPDGLRPDAFSARPPDRGADEPARLVHYDFVEARLHRLVRLAIEKEHISLGRGAEILDIKLETMRDIANSWVG